MHRLVICLLVFLMAADPCPTTHAAAYDPATVGNSYLEPPPSLLDEAQPLQSTIGTSPSYRYNGKELPRGGGLIPAGYNPFGYKMTPLGEKFLEFSGSLDSDIGRFIASIKERKSLANIKSQWLEIVRVSKSAQSMRIYRTLQEIIDFCLEAGLIN